MLMFDDPNKNFFQQVLIFILSSYFFYSNDQAVGILTLIDSVLLVNIVSSAIYFQ